MDAIQIIDTDSGNIHDLGICGYKSPKRPGFPEKVSWMKEREKEGLKIKSLFSKEDGTQGMIEYIPGEYCWRPVDARGYMFIHCLFTGFRKAYQRKGYASLLLDACESDARKVGMSGGAVVTRKSSFMVGKDIFLKRGYKVADKAPSDFELLVLKYNEKHPLPKFKKGLGSSANQFSDGLTIIRADQCPYTVKNVNEIVETAEKQFGLTTRVITLTSHKQAQESPCAFGIFCIIYQGKIIAEHPISKTRFVNIMNNPTLT